MILSSKAEWAANMHALHHEAAGALELWTVLLTDLPHMLAEAHEGNADALRILRIVNDAVEHMKTAPPSLGPICACCGRALHNSDFSFVVTLPSGQPNAERAMALAICAGCGTDRVTVRAAAIKALRLVWPDAREIAISSQMGRA